MPECTCTAYGNTASTSKVTHAHCAVAIELTLYACKSWDEFEREREKNVCAIDTHSR